MFFWIAIMAHGQTVAGTQLMKTIAFLNLHSHRKH